MDAAFLYFETPTMHLHVVGVLVLDPGDLLDGFTIERLGEVLTQRIHLIPQLRRRMLASPGGIDHPLWIEDPDFALSDHVRSAASRGPMSWAGLESFTGEVAGRPLDRAKPLWEMWLADLEGGDVALVTKLHHSLMDGGTGGDLMASIFDLTADGDGPPRPDEAWSPDTVPSLPSRFAGSVTSLVSRQRAVPGALARTFTSISGTARTWASERRSGNRVPLTAPGTPFNGALTSRRSVGLTRVDLDTVLAIRRAFATTVNDVVLAVSATALRRYLAARDAVPRRDLVAAVPVSVHGPGHVAPADGDLVNQVSIMMVPLPLGPDDPVARLAAVHANATSSKVMQSAFGPDSLQELTGLALPPLMTATARLYSGLGLARYHPPVMNLVISNVPGPPVDLYCAGAKVTGIFPMGPVMEGSGVNITVLSEARHLNIGIMACPDLLDDVDELARLMVEAVDELAELAQGTVGAAAGGA